MADAKLPDGKMNGKFTPIEKAMLANTVDQAIKLEQRAVNSAKHEPVKEAHQRMVKELQDLFVKVRQEL